MWKNFDGRCFWRLLGKVTYVDEGGVAVLGESAILGRCILLRGSGARLGVRFLCLVQLGTGHLQAVEVELFCSQNMVACALPRVSRHQTMQSCMRAGP